MHTDGEGEHVFQRKNRFWMHCSELFAKQSWSIVFDLVIWSLFARVFVWQFQSEDVTWQPLSPLTANQCVLVFICFAYRFPPLGNSSQLWSDSKLEQTWTWLPLTLDSVLVPALPTGLPVLLFWFFQCCQFRLLLFLHPVVAFFLFCWFWADFWFRVFGN